MGLVGAVGGIVEVRGVGRVRERGGGAGVDEVDGVGGVNGVMAGTW